MEENTAACACLNVIYAPQPDADPRFVRDRWHCSLCKGEFVKDKSKVADPYCPSGKGADTLHHTWLSFFVRKLESSRLDEEIKLIAWCPQCDEVRTKVHEL